MLYDSETGNLTLVASGDAMLTRRLSVFREQKFTALWEIFRSADVGFTNLEMLMHEYEHSPGTAGGTYTASDPRNIEELKWGGINLVSLANNHHYDYGEGGLLTNLSNVRNAGLVHAGTGPTLSHARAAGYLDTSNGRVALISASSTFAEAGRALDQRPDSKGRPGLNSLRFDTTYTIDKLAFDELHRISEGLGFEVEKTHRQNFADLAYFQDTETKFEYQGEKYVLGETFNTETTPNEADLDGNLKWIRDARRMSDWVIVSIHSHEYGATREDPPDFLRTFARACIDEGADIFIGHGPHFDKGIEIYNGKPIFYSLGNFIFQNDTVAWQPAHNYDLQKLDHYSTPADFYDARTGNDSRGFPANPVYWESIVVECRFESRELQELKLHPIDLGFGRPRSQRGRPLIADGDVARRTLERMQRLSEPFGTAIEVNGNLGMVKL